MSHPTELCQRCRCELTPLDRLIGKIMQLSPADQALIESMADRLLALRDEVSEAKASAYAGHATRSA